MRSNGSVGAASDAIDCFVWSPFLGWMDNIRREKKNYVHIKWQ